MDIKYLKGVGEKRAEAFNKIGITSLEDFIRVIPRLYVKQVNIRDVRNHFADVVIVYGKVIEVEPAARMNQPVRIFLNDGTGTIEIPMFGATEFRSKQFRLHENYLFYGKVAEGWATTKFKLDYKDHLKLEGRDELEKKFLKLPFIPVYQIQGELKKLFIKPLLLARIVHSAFSVIYHQRSEIIKETLNENIRKSMNLMSKREAIAKINFPQNEVERETARKRNAFDELFYLEMIMAFKKRMIKNETKGISFKSEIKKLSENFVKCIDFELTDAQKRVINEIYSDMKSDNVMNRLLQGDVGSGKTLVAIFAMLIAAENEYQSAFMCPTELLAEQHFHTITDFIEKFNQVSGKDYKVAFLVGGQKKRLREQIYQDIRLGKAQFIVGTHALIQEAVDYKNLGFAIIDEQHKFGVLQRAKLKEKGLNPDVLVMTATPIPRTLSLTIYGDLDVSVIDEMPLHRKPVKTFLREESDKKNVYGFIKDEIKKGRQVYFVYPLIEESEKMDLKSAEENYQILKKRIFPGLQVGMIHGRMFWYEKDEVMKDFKDKKMNILVSTTVIEVGIDIPNATIMIIEDAQRFGLSQLHQLRGRVGRGSEQSYCILIGKNLDEISKRRLEIMCETTDGFKIAEADMEIRGPGEFYGLRQSGELNFQAADLYRDRELLLKARDIAFKLVDEDPQLRKQENQNIRNYFIANYKDSLYLMKIA